MQNSEINNILNLLVNQQLHSISRIENIAFFGFGDDYKTPQSFEAHRLAENGISLQIQCSWRMIDHESKAILFASSDIYRPSDSSEWTHGFKWYKPDMTTLFDEKTKNLINSAPDIFVESFELNGWGDLILHFSNRYVMRIFVESSTERECWSLTEHRNGRNELVVYGDGLYIGKCE